MAVIVDSGPLDADAYIHQVPVEKYAELINLRRYKVKTSLGYDCRCLVRYVDEAKEMFSTLGYNSVETLLQSGLGLSPEDVEIAVSWLRRNEPEVEIPFRIAVTLGQKEYGKGKPGPGRGHKTSRNTRCLGESDTVEYVLGRLDRDGHTKLAAQVRAETISANAAAIKVGFRKKSTPLITLRRAWAKADTVERATFLEEIGHQ